MDESEFVNVAIRIKPGDQKNIPCLQIVNKEPPVLLVTDRCQTFTFDQIFDSVSCQKTVYEQAVKPFVNYVKEGYNCTVFAYGQTGTGKTFTIGTESEVAEEENLGLIPRALKELFQCDNHDNSETEIFVSFIEIYNERAFDLLQNNPHPLVIKGMKPQGYSKEKVYNLSEAQHFLKMGNKNRHTAGTKQNSKSSRSHAIFSIYCNSKNKGAETTAKLNLVDLAGCESVKKTGNQGSTFHEGVNINKGLLAISQVMIALSTNANFIPYRQSIITSVLQDSLNKRNYISLIACVSSLQEDTTETLQTLDFAQRLKKVKSRPEINEVIAQFRKQNPNLFCLTKQVNTPFKRPMTQTQQTPSISKRFKPLEASTEMINSNFEENHSSKSLLSLNRLSTVSSTGTHITQQTLSPIIKKYISEVEDSLMGKLEIMIKTELKRSSHELESRRQEEKENAGSPRLHWNKIQDEVSKIVKSEMCRLTKNSIQVTSTPIELEDLNYVIDNSRKNETHKIRKTLVYDSPEFDHYFQPEKTATPVFKVPEIPFFKNRDQHKKSRVSISPIENNFTKPRRSLRLSLKNVDISNSSDFDCSKISIDNKNADSTLTNENISNKSVSVENRRRSVRLLNKVDTMNVNISSIYTIDKTDKRAPSGHERRNKNLNIANTPAGKRIMKNTRQDSPSTAHTKKVLNVLKMGSVKELEKLQLIGVKTAQQLVLFRQIKGNLNSISDLSQMPGWGEKKFERFIDQNFLKKELLQKSDW